MTERKSSPPTLCHDLGNNGDAGYCRIDYKCEQTLVRKFFQITSWYLFRNRDI